MRARLVANHPAGCGEQMELKRTDILACSRTLEEALRTFAEDRSCCGRPMISTITGDVNVIQVRPTGIILGLYAQGYDGNPTDKLMAVYTITVQETKVT